MGYQELTDNQLSRKEYYLKKLREIFKDKLDAEITFETLLKEAFPLKERFRVANEIEDKLDCYFPDFTLSTTNLITRVVVIGLTLLLMVSTVLSFMFYLIINNPSSFIGVLILSLVFPYSVVSFFFPHLIKKSGFGKMRNVDDLLNEMVLINR